MTGGFVSLTGCASNQFDRTSAPDGFYIGTDTAPNFSIGSGPGTIHIHEDGDFLPQHFAVSPTDQTPGGYLIQVSGQGTEKMLDLSGIVIVANHKVYFGNAKRVGSTASVSLLLDKREEADAVSSMLQRRYALQPSISIPPITNAPPQMNSPQSSEQPGNSEANRAFDDYVAKQREDRIRGVPPPPSQFPFPNVYGEPLHPSPNYVNFYAINDHYPDYLECTYDVDVKNYNQSNEQKWFKAALKQARRSGPTKFPPIKWIAVIICNEAEWKDANTMDQAYKVGAIFKASDVFDSSSDLSQLIANATMDRHPFFLDRKRPDMFPAEQQRWMIVERHATNNPATAPK